MSSNSGGLGITSTGMSSNGAPLQQITGLASGLDTSSIINALMAIERQPLVNLQNQLAVEQQRQTDLQNIQTQLQTFQTAAQSLSDPNTWGNTQTVSTSNSSALTAQLVGGAPAGAFVFNVTQLARAAQSTQTKTLASANADDTLTITVGSSSVQVAVKAGDTMDSIAANINAATGTPVYAATVNGNLVLSSRTTGAGNDIAVSSTGTLASDLGMNENITPQSAQYSLDGVAQPDSTTNTVTTAVGGLSIQFLATGSTTVTVSAPGPNTTTITNAIQSFVTTYNQTVDMIYQKLNEKPVVNPQTTADRAKGDLQDDPGLLSLLSQLRESASDVFSNLPSGANLLSQAGLSTGAAVGTGTISQDSLEGKLTLDTTALGNLLATNFAAVKQMFTNPTTSYSTQGLSQRLAGILNTWNEPSGVMASRLSGEASTISYMQSQETDLNARMDAKQAALQKQFSDLETALSQEQSQGSWLSSQISGLNANN